MSRIYRVIWSEARRAWVVASELARARGKSGRRRSAVAPVSCTPTGASMTAMSPRFIRLAVLLALNAPAHAADWYWDPNNTGVGSGGTGNWDTTGAFWSQSTDGVTGPYSSWNNLALDHAIFNSVGAVEQILLLLSRGSLSAQPRIDGREKFRG